MVENTDEIYVVEYSKKDGAFQIETLDMVLYKNRSAICSKLDVTTTYVPIDVASSYEEACELRDRFAKGLLQTK